MPLSMTKQLTVSIPVKMCPEFKASLAVKLGMDDLARMSDSDLRSYLSPKPEDYVLIPWRALSAASVQFDTINFGHNGGAALKEAVDMFNGLIILKDHDQTVDKWVGKTQDAYWDESIPDTPPGVNFMLRIDTKADPKLARGLVSGMVESGSVTIMFDYDMSHPDMDEFEFYSQMGQVVKGKLVQALVTKVTRTFEYSVVWQGADSDAKRIRPNGTVDKSGLSQQTEETDMKKLAAKLSLAETATEDEIVQALDVKLAAEATAATTVTSLTTENSTLKTQLATKSTEAGDLQTKLTTAEGQVTSLTAEKTTLTTEVTALKQGQAAFEAHLTKRRAEALRLYNLAESDKALEPMKKTIEGADLELTESFVTTYGAKVEQLMPMSCTKCGCTDVTRRLSQQSATETETSSLEASAATSFTSAVKGIHG